MGDNLKVKFHNKIFVKPKTLRVEFIFLDYGESLQDWKFAFKAFFSSGLFRINKTELD